MAKFKRYLLGAAIGAGIGYLIYKNRDEIKRKIEEKKFMHGGIRKGKYEDENGTLHEVIGIAKDPDTDSDVVIYKALEKGKGVKEGQMFVMSKGDFTEEREIEGETRTRFRYVGDRDSDDDEIEGY